MPKGYRKAYSAIGRSLNDICLRSKNNYCKEIKEIRCGYISTGFNPTSEFEEEMEVANLEFRDDYCLAAGVIECKKEKYAIHQTIAEMIRYAGDLLADALLKGHSVNIISVYGLALNYDTKSAKLVHLGINFHKETSQTFVSDATVPLYPAISWLLNAIVQ